MINIQTKNYSSNREQLLHKFENFSRSVIAERKNDNRDLDTSRRFAPPWLQKNKQLIPPFTYYGGKRRIAWEVWRRFGVDIPNYIEPFGGGLSVLLARPFYDLRKLTKYRELVNDANCLLLNFWRAIQSDDFEKVMKIVDFPAHEKELLVRREHMIRKLPELAAKMDDVDEFDPVLAAYWLYTQRHWIGSGADDPYLSPERKMIRARECGILGNSLAEHAELLNIRTRHVRFHNTPDWRDWLRVVISETQTTGIGTSGFLLDPPYIGTTDYYSGRLDSKNPGDRVPLEVREWALENGERPDFCIAHCGLLHHHDDFFPKEGKNRWTRFSWKKASNRSKQNNGANPQIDTIWFSPHCLKIDE